MEPECHCGKDGHPLHSQNCPAHGAEAQQSRAAVRLYYALNGHGGKIWEELPVCQHAFWLTAAAECLEGAADVRAHR